MVAPGPVGRGWLVHGPGTDAALARGDQAGQDLGFGRGQGGGEAAGAGGHGALGGVQRGGEGDPVGVQPGAGGGADDDDPDGLVDGQVGPQFLAGQVRALAAQDPAGAAQIGLAFAVSGLDRPPPGVAGGQLPGRVGTAVGQRGDQPVPLGPDSAVPAGDGQGVADDPDGDAGQRPGIGAERAAAAAAAAVADGAAVDEELDALAIAAATVTTPGTTNKPARNRGSICPCPSETARG